MNLTSPSQVRALLDSIGVRPCKALGQNFLIDRNILDIITSAADLSRSDAVLEIGPGLGVVTARLVELAGRVMAIEKDVRLFDYLKNTLASSANLELVCGDAVDIDVDAISAAGFNKLVSNLPFSTGSRILMNFAMAQTPPERMVVTLQQEVADRMCAAHSTREYGVLTIWMQGVYSVVTVKTISPTCFCPTPDVGSAIVSLSRNSMPVMSAAERDVFRKITRHAFQHRRKQMHAIFRREGCQGISLEAVLAAMKGLGLDGKARPESISVENWRALARWLQ